jgi:hypothetical protein
MSEWPTQATETIEQVVGVVRERGVEPVQRATKTIVVGIVAVAAVLTAFFLVSVALFRGLVELYQGEVWAAWLTMGGIFAIAGAVLWSQRTP